jgi:hypothetical protein
MSQAALAFELSQLIYGVFFSRPKHVEMGLWMGSDMDFYVPSNFESIRKTLKNGNSKLSRLKNTLVCHS